MFVNFSYLKKHELLTAFLYVTRLPETKTNESVTQGIDSKHVWSEIHIQTYFYLQYQRQYIPVKSNGEKI